MLIAHTTDPHIGLVSSAQKGHIDSVAALRRALGHVRGLTPAPNALLISGDLTDMGRESDYQIIAGLLQSELLPHAEGGPLVLAVPGNHDLRANARRVLADIMPVAADAPNDLLCLHVHHGGVHLIGLDPVVPMAPHGALAAAQLGWLERQLAACAGEPVVIFLHHPPMVTGMAVMDACGLLQGRAELARLVEAHGGVELIAAGHMHRPITGRLAGVPVVVLPSTSHQLELDLRPAGGLACRMEPTMVGLYRWSPDGMACHLS